MKKAFKSIATGVALAAISLPSLATTANELEGLWLLTSANTSISTSRGDFFDQNSGSVKSACSITKLSESLLATDCLVGGNLAMSGSQLSSQDGSWQLTLDESGNIVGSLTIINQQNGEQISNASMSISMHKIAPLNAVIGTASINKNGATQAADVKGFAYSTMSTSGNADGNNTVNNLVLMLANGQVALVNTAIGVDVIQATIGELTVSDTSTSEITLNASENSINASFDGHDQSDASIFSGTANIVF